jgi:hypothetical protein
MERVSHNLTLANCLYIEILTLQKMSELVRIAAVLVSLLLDHSEQH